MRLHWLFRLRNLEGSSIIAVKSVVLTDLDNNVWHEQFSLSPVHEPGLILAGSKNWSISKRTLRGGLSDRVDVIELDNGALSVSILPTRGMGLWRGEYRPGDGTSIPLGWDSPVRRPVNPAFVNLTEGNGLGWLAGFNEWLCRCGLAFHGPPGTDVIVREDGSTAEASLTLHGKIANTPAHYVEIDVSTKGDGVLGVRGVVDEAMLFGPRLRLTTTIATGAGSNRLRIADEITNLAAEPAEFELLYHTNMGRPFLEEDARFVAPLREVAPRDARAAEGIETWQTYRGPTPGDTEQAYFMELVADDEGETLALLRNAAGDRGVSLHFNRRQCPWFTLWKNTQPEADGYVTGLEPSTSLPNLKTFERKQGRVITLAPGQTYGIDLEIAVRATADEVAEAESRIATIQASTIPTVHLHPVSRFTPA